MTNNLYPVINTVAGYLLGGRVLQAREVSAGNGQVIDWRTVRSGETLLEGACAYDTAALFIDLVGPEAAISSI